MAVFDAHANLAVSTVAAAPMPPESGTVLIVAAGEGSRLTAAPPFNVTVHPVGQVPTPLNAEVARVTARTGDTLTLVRAQEGSTARTILVGDLIYLSITAKALTDIEQALTTGAPVLHHLTHEDGGSDEVTLAQSQITGLTTVLSGKVETTDPRLSDARPPLAHALTHASAGSDPVTVTALAGYPGGTTSFLRADGAFATPTAGPAAHHLTHEPGGSDALTALSASTLTTGTLPDARLSANVQMKPIAAADLPAHASRHQPGGADAMVVDAVAATGSLRTLGTGATQAASGTDTRFTNARTPTAHATTHSAGQSDPVTVTALAGYPGGSTTFLRADGTFATPATGVPAAHHLTHETGGTDMITALSAAVLTTGTLNDARLSGNVVLENISNVFTNAAAIDLAATSPRLRVTDLSQGLNLKRFEVINEAQELRFRTISDDLTTDLAYPLALTRTGDLKTAGTIIERARTTPLGAWIAEPYNPANYGADPPMVWTPTAGQIVNRYTLIGKTLIWTLAITDSTLSGTATTTLHVVIPGGLAPATTMLGGAGFGFFGGWMPIMVQLKSANTIADVFTQNAGPFPIGPAYIQFTVSFEIP